MGIFGNLFGGNDDDGDDDDGDDDDRPVAPWQNVSQERLPVEPLREDDDATYWEKPDGSIIATRPVDNEGDD
jgi:hypothetical protein